MLRKHRVCSYERREHWRAMFTKIPISPEIKQLFLRMAIEDIRALSDKRISFAFVSIQV